MRLAKRRMPLIQQNASAELRELAHVAAESDALEGSGSVRSAQCPGLRRADRGI
jgi:hypothetical protein